MSEIRSKAVTEVSVDGRNAEEVLKELRLKADEYRRAMTEAQKANNLVNYNNAERSAKEYEKAIRSVQKGVRDVDSVMKNLSGATSKELQRAQRSITAEMNGMTRGTAEFVARSKQLQQVTAEIRKVRTEMTGLGAAQQGVFGRMAAGFNNYFGIATAMVASVTGLGLYFRKLADDAMNFEEKVADLSAITGLAGEDLDWLAQQAKNLSTTTTEDGVRITRSADEIVEAFKLMGSAKPELLENKEALSQVTTEALKLAEASKMDTSKAVLSLAKTMNQFGAGAHEASRYINVLAAGSKAGAAEVGDIAEAIVNFGAAANMANITVEESNGLIQTLAEKGITGSEAGTMLRNVLLSLQGEADNLNPAVVGIQKAFENLAKENRSAAEMQKLFGDRAFTAGVILTENTDKLAHFTDAVTDTSVAIEQANINSDTQKAKLQQVRNELKLNSMELGAKLAPAFSNLTFTMSKFIKLLTVVVPWLHENWRIIASLAVGLVTYAVAVKAVTVAKTAYTANTNFAKTATVGFNTAMKKNVIGLFAAALAAAITYLLAFRRSSDEAKVSVDNLSKTQEAFNDIMLNKKSIEERMGILSTLNKRQLDTLRANIEEQVLAEENFTALLLIELKKRLDNDRTIADLRSKLSVATSDFQKAFIENQLKHRERDVAHDLQAQHNLHKSRLANLNRYLVDVNAAYANVPTKEEVIVGPDFETLEKELVSYMERKRLAMHKDYLQGKFDKERLDAELRILEVAHLESLLALRRQFGEETLDIDLKLTQERIKLMEEASKANRAIMDAALRENIVDNQKIIQDSVKASEDAINAIFEESSSETEMILAARKEMLDNAFQEFKQQAEGFKQIAEGFAGSMGDLLGDFVSNADMSSEEFNKRLVMNFLDLTHSIVRMAVAQVWAQSLASAESVATWGAAGVIKAIAITALVEGAFAGVKALVSNAMSTPQRFAGKYDVIGADDGRTYRNVPYRGNMSTGIYSTPTLVAERGPELIVDGATTRNLQMNFPEVLSAIHAARVPQRASGNLDTHPSSRDASSKSSLADAELKALIAQNNSVMYELQLQIRKGISASISYQHLTKRLDDGRNIEKSVSRSSP